MRTSNRRLRRLEARLAMEAQAAAEAAETARQPQAYVAIYDSERPGAAERLIDVAAERGGFVTSFAPNRWPEPELGPRAAEAGWLFEAGTFAHEREAQATLLAHIGPDETLFLIPCTGADVHLYYLAANGLARVCGEPPPYPDVPPDTVRERPPVRISGRAA